MPLSHLRPWSQRLDPCKHASTLATSCHAIVVPWLLLGDWPLNCMLLHWQKNDWTTWSMNSWQLKLNTWKLRAFNMCSLSLKHHGKLLAASLIRFLLLRQEGILPEELIYKPVALLHVDRGAAARAWTTSWLSLVANCFFSHSRFAYPISICRIWLNSPGLNLYRLLWLKALTQSGIMFRSILRNTNLFLSDFCQCQCQIGTKPVKRVDFLDGPSQEIHVHRVFQSSERDPILSKIHRDIQSCLLGSKVLF